MKVFATDEAGNTASADIDSRVFPKVFRKSRIDVADTFLQRVVPAILENTADFAREVADPNDLVAAFLKINGDLRQQERRDHRRAGVQVRADHAVAGRVPAAGQLAGRGRLCRSPDVLPRRQGDRSAGAPRLRSRRHGRRAHRRRRPRQGRLCRLPRHLRQLRHRGPRPGRAVALRASVVDRRQGGRRRAEGRGTGPQRHDWTRRRRPPALHDAGRRIPGQPGGLVVHAVDGGPHAAKDSGSRREDQ